MDKYEKAKEYFYEDLDYNMAEVLNNYSPHFQNALFDFVKNLYETFENEKEEKDEEIKIQKPPTSLPLQIAILSEIGFFELEKFKNLSSTQKENLISILLNRPDKRAIRGNFNVLNKDSNEDDTKYTSFNNLEKAREIIKNP